MESSASIHSGKISDQLHQPNSPSKLKTYGFALAIIAGLAGLAVGGVGFAGHLGVLSNVSHASLMMAAGGGGGLLLLTAGVIGSVKSCQATAVHTQNRTVYGPEAWPEFGTRLGCTLELVGEVPPAPEEPVAEGMIRLYIPERVKVDGVEKDFNLNTLVEIAEGSFDFFSQDVKVQLGENSASGWVDIDRTAMEWSRSQTYATQKEMVENRGYRMPHILEAVVLNLMVFAITGERLYGEEPMTYTRCEEQGYGRHPVIVGGFGSSGLNVSNLSYSDGYIFGVVGVRKFC